MWLIEKYNLKKNVITHKLRKSESTNSHLKFRHAKDIKCEESFRGPDANVRLSLPMPASFLSRSHQLPTRMYL